MMVEIIKFLRKLKKESKITTQQFKTFRGQVLNGDTNGCLKGLKRMKLM